MAKASWIDQRDVLYSVPGDDWRPGVPVTRPDTHASYANNKTHLGARVVEVRSTEIDAKIFQGGFWRTLTFARSLAPAAIANDPICLRVTGDGIQSYAVVEAFPTRFASASDASNPAGLGIIPDSIRYE